MLESKLLPLLRFLLQPGQLYEEATDIYLFFDHSNNHTARGPMALNASFFNKDKPKEVNFVMDKGERGAGGGGL